MSCPIGSCTASWLPCWSLVRPIRLSWSIRMSLRFPNPRLHPESSCTRISSVPTCSLESSCASLCTLLRKLCKSTGESDNRFLGKREYLPPLAPSLPKRLSWKRTSIHFGSLYRLPSTLQLHHSCSSASRNVQHPYTRWWEAPLYWSPPYSQSSFWSVSCMNTISFRFSLLYRVLPSSDGQALLPVQRIKMMTK